MTDQHEAPTRYSGEHGNENFIDDYVFAPMILTGIIVVAAGIGAYTHADVGLVVGALCGVGIDYKLYRLEMNAREKNE